MYRLAGLLTLAGWVGNTGHGVTIELEGPARALELFLERLETELPPNAFIQTIEPTWLAPVGHRDFEIRESESVATPSAIVLPDVATCPDCVHDITDPRNRRYQYPFTNCTNCGPRFSIIESLPYDRAGTSMRTFEMCPECRREYEDPADRRFHAQPNACPECGPRLALWDGGGRPMAEAGAALTGALAALREGAIIAVKGLGGFHLMVDARSDDCVERLRARKHRDEKPLAVMFPSLTAVEMTCRVSVPESRLLRSPASPIVLLEKRPHAHVAVAAAVAPGNPRIGAMLPYTPLHILMLNALGFPVVATSGNLSDEPICIDEMEALERLGGIADAFLVHNRPIVRHVDDSVAHVVCGREQVLRRARGFAPLPLRRSDGRPALAVGAHLKNTIALATGPQVFMSQHIGDLETEPALRAFENVIGDLSGLYRAQPEVVVCDQHPDYLSTRHARESGLPVVAVQHHLAHVYACMAENDVQAPVLGVSWDGTGYGPDGTVWGGEFFVVTDEGWRRAGHLRCFRLPGGERAVREPRRSALGVLHELGRENGGLAGTAHTGGFSASELRTLVSMLDGGVNSPWTSSAGRLFDAVSSIVELRHENRFEGQGAMALEHVSIGRRGDDPYAVPIIEGAGGPESGFVLDWGPMIRSILDDVDQGVAAGTISARFHRALVEAIIGVARHLGIEQVILTGGCFQNRRLTEGAVTGLSNAGFTPVWHQRIPPNDGGIAAGQIAAAQHEGAI